jgi:hypothetical protein
MDSQQTVRDALREDFFRQIKPIVKQISMRYASENLLAELCINDFITSLGKAMEETGNEMSKGDYCVRENL